MRILSTKILTSSQKMAFHPLDLIEVPLIAILPLKKEITQKINNAIFTSLNAVASVFEENKTDPHLFKNIFCVGKKTASFLEKKKIKILFIASRSSELADFLIEKGDKIKKIDWFCGDIKNSDLKTRLEKNAISVRDRVVYRTILLPRKIDEFFDLILFYSPSGVRSFLMENRNVSTPVVCIGDTTAREAEKYFEKVYISDNPNVESVIKKVRKLIQVDQSGRNSQFFLKNG